MNALILVAVLAQIQSPIQQQGIKPFPVPYNAVEIAYADSQQYSESGDSLFYRYVWMPNLDWLPLLDISCNFVLSHVPNSVVSLDVPARSFGTFRLQGGVVVRLDMREWNQGTNLLNCLHTWEQMRETERYFLTNQTTQLTKFKVGWSRYKNKAGKWFTYKTFPTKQLRMMGPHLPESASALQIATGSEVPIVRFDDFLTCMWQNTAGGLYYEWRNITPSTTIETFFARSGGKLNTVAMQQWATFRSGITDRERGIRIVPTLGMRPTTGAGVGFFSLDFSIEDAVATNAEEFNPCLNLINGRFSASEAFNPMANGLYEFAVFTVNADGTSKLARFVDPKVATDSSITSNRVKLLQPGSSCVRCHAKSELFHPLSYNNSVQRIAEGKGDFFILSNQQTLNQLRGLYQGDFDSLLKRCRNNLSTVITEITGDGEPDNTQRLLLDIFKVHDSYLDQNITASIACKEIGLQTENPQQASRLINQLMQPLQVEDIRVGALKENGKLPPMNLTRQSWKRIYIDAAFRAMQINER